jgi:hypothetical protein
MAYYRHKLKPTPSRLLAGFGAVTPRQKPENWHKVRSDMEEAMAAEVATEISSHRPSSLLGLPSAYPILPFETTCRQKIEPRMP